MSTFELMQPVEACVSREMGKYNTMLSNIHMDIGGARNREQQDSAWMYEDDSVKICVIADGHGSVYGRVASLACTKACEAFFSPENIRQLLEQPYKTLTEVFVCAHEKVKQDIIAANAKSGGTFEEAGDEVCIKEANRLSVADGGSTLTITVFTDEYIYTANVADSKTLLMTNDRSINQSAITVLGDSAKECGYNKYGEKQHFNKDFTEQIPEPLPETAENVNVLELTASHSPTDWKEFERLRDFRGSESKLPFARLQYPDTRNVGMRDIFTEKDGVITKSENGYYYKNVSQEFASLFCSEESIRSLAMTRSIGDFYGISAGLSHRPEVRRFDLKKVFENKRALRESACKKLETQETPALEEKHSEADNYVVVVMGSDGVWDNWRDEDTNKFIFYPTCIDAVVTKGKEGVNAVAKSFADRNTLYGNRNFKSMADNASCIVAMIHEC